MDLISKGNLLRKEKLKEVGFYRQILMIQQDLSFIGTIHRGIRNKAIRSIKYLIDYILEQINEEEY